MTKKKTNKIKLKNDYLWYQSMKQKIAKKYSKKNKK